MVDFEDIYVYISLSLYVYDIIVGFVCVYH